MARFGFLAAWSAEGPLDERWPARADAEVEALGGRFVATQGDLRLAVFGDLEGRIRRHGEADMVLGALFCAPPAFVVAPERLETRAEGPVSRARRLLEGYWGGYVALLRDAQGWSVLRDPSGALEAIAWTIGPLRCAASALDLTPASLKPRLSVNWETLGAQVADRLLTSGAPPLRGLEAVPPGALRRASGATAALWTPAQIAATRELEPSAEALRDVAKGCVAAWGSILRRPLVEVSGGLDSAVVTAALGPVTRGRAAGFVHQVVEEPGADERPYARAVAAHLRLALLEAAKAETRLEPGRLTALAEILRPAFNAADVDYDVELSRRARERDADAIVTGQGGDAVFLTMRSPAVAIDLLRRRGVGALRGGDLIAQARWVNRSVWALVMGALAAPLRRRASPSFARFASDDARRCARLAEPHPWLADARSLSPARQLQVEGLVDALIFQGESLRSRAVSLVHPLLSQPLIEAVLATPLDQLLRGGRDRGLAREAFAGVLPPSVVRRRTKGDMTAYYGRMIARELESLRPFLLEGRLAQAGWLDLDQLARALAPERLAADGGYGEIMDLAMQEAFARQWVEAGRR